jgi:exonuclease VII large subunit
MSRVTNQQLQAQLTASRNTLKQTQEQLSKAQTQLRENSKTLEETRRALEGTRKELSQTKEELAKLKVPSQEVVISEKKGKQRAYLFGLNYPGTENELRGCVPDVKLMSSILKGKFGYNPDDVHVYTDAELIGEKDILDYLSEGIVGLESGDFLFFHYSGHGTQVRDRDGDEPDGLDEAIYTRHGVVSDDEIAKVVGSIPAGVTVVMIFDCCNSGTICDLPYRFISQTYNLKESSKPFLADIITVVGCRDNQTSADAYIAERKGNYGALTSTLVKLIETQKTNNMNWKTLCTQLQTILKRGGYTQIPQLSSNKEELFNRPVKFSL